MKSKNQEIIDVFNYRYACKKTNKDKKVSDKDKFIKKFNFLNFLEEDEKKNVAEVIYDLSVDKYRKNHKVIIEYKDKTKEERRKEI